MPDPRNTSAKPGIHPRSKHQGRYAFKELNAANPALEAHVGMNKFSNESINFFDPDAVRELNKALLIHYYGLDWWDIPDGYLCPPIPGRADYIHHVADLLADSNFGRMPSGRKVRCLDVGIGANCVYPIIGNSEYGWHFVGSDIDPDALKSAKQIIESNPLLMGKVELRLQSEPAQVLKGIVKPDEKFDLTICNPPFHASLAEAQAGTDRKLKNLGGPHRVKGALNFGGKGGELWTEGGEKGFILKMAEESSSMPKSCMWFSSLVSKEAHLNAIYRGLAGAGARERRVIEMGVGNKRSRMVVWSFLNARERREWVKERWS